MTIYATLPTSGLTHGDVRETLNDALARLRAIEAAMGSTTPTPTPSPTPTPTPSPPADPTATDDMLPALSAPYHVVFSTERLLASYSGPLLQRRTAGGQVDSVGDGQLRYAADQAGTVPVLYDQTGNGRFAANTTPAQQPALSVGRKVGARQAIEFNAVPDGAGRILLDTGAGGAALALPQNSRTEFWVIDPMYSALASVWATHGNTGYIGTAGLPGGPPYAAADDNAATISTAYTVLPGLPSQPMVLVIRVEPDGVTVWLDGLKRPKVAGTPATANMTSVLLGCLSGQPTHYNGNFRLAAFGEVAGAISDAEAAQLSAKLSARFGVSTAAPTVNIVHVGDSIVASGGSVDGRAWRYYVQPQLNARTRWTNFGVGGKTLAECYRDHTFYDAKALMTGARNILLIDAATNDGPTAALYDNTTIPYVAWAKAQGFRVVVVDVLPRADHADSGWEAGRAAYNARVLANAAGADAIIRRSQNGQMGSAANTADPTKYDSIGVHPTPLGYSLLAPDYVAVLNAVIAAA